MTHAWLAYALLGPVLWAISTHIDKYLVVRYFSHVHPAVLLVFTGIVNLAALPLLWWLDPRVLAIGTHAILLMTLSGIMLMAAMLLYLLALQTAEASVVAPFFQASPVFAIGLSYVVLGERLDARQLAGAALVIAGTTAAALRTGSGAGRFHVRLIALMLGCALTIALSSLVFKMFALEDEFWTTTFWLFAGESLFAAGVLALPRMRSQFLELFEASKAALVGINGANELINLGGGLATRYALTMAPLGLVQAVSSTTTVFVFIIGLALTLLFPHLGREDLTRGEVVRKGVAAVLVAIGVTLAGS